MRIIKHQTTTLNISFISNQFSPICSDDAQFHKSGCDTLATSYMSHHFEWDAFENLPRQALKRFFHDDGNIFIFKVELQKVGRWIGDNPYRMKILGIYKVEIDGISKFWANEGILRRLSEGIVDTSRWF